MRRITSRQNALVRLARDLARPRRDGDARVLLDGAHLLGEALAAGVPIGVVAAADDLSGLPEGARLLAAAAAAGAETYAVTPEVLAAMSPARTPSGVVSIGEVGPAPLERALEGRLALVAAAFDIQDPGNVGAIVRAADAAGATAVLFGGASADPFGWKALRGSMGSAFRIPVVPRVQAGALLAACRARAIRTWATTPRGGTDLFAADLSGPVCLLAGGEGGGLAPALLAGADHRLSVPMRAGVESLNVAVATALVCYEALRQRRDLPPRSDRSRRRGRT